MHDPTSIFRFTQEHDVLHSDGDARGARQPTQKGMSEVSRNARQGEPPSRRDDHAPRREHQRGGIPLPGARRQIATGPALTCRPRAIGAGGAAGAPPERKADNQILRGGSSTCRTSIRGATGLVSKDKNMRIKGSMPLRALGPRITVNDNGARGTPTCSTSGTRACPRTSGTARQGNGIVAAGRLHLLPHTRPVCSRTGW